MSIIKGGIHDGFSGKTGSVVGYYRLGKWIVRSLPRKTRKNKIGTDKQNQSRSKFKIAQKFLKPLIHIIRLGYRELSQQKLATGHNLAMSHVLKETFNEQGEIDLTKFLISQGSLSPLSPISLSGNGEEIELTWDPKHPLNISHGFDQLLIAVYDVEQGKALFQGTDALRKEGQTRISLKSDTKKNRNYHVWVGCINDSRSLVGNSQYVGMVHVP